MKSIPTNTLSVYELLISRSRVVVADKFLDVLSSKNLPSKSLPFSSENDALHEFSAVCSHSIGYRGKEYITDRNMA